MNEFVFRFRDVKFVKFSCKDYKSKIFIRRRFKYQNINREAQTLDIGSSVGKGLFFGPSLVDNSEISVFGVDNYRAEIWSGKFVDGIGQTTCFFRPCLGSPFWGPKVTPRSAIKKSRSSIMHNALRSSSPIRHISTNSHLLQNTKGYPFSLRNSQCFSH